VCSFIVSAGWIVLEHPHIMEPNEKQLEKIGLFNEFISSYNLLKIYELFGGCNK